MTRNGDRVQPGNSFRSRPWMGLFATAGIVGQVVLLASAMLLPLVSEFSFVGDNISELVLGRFGVVQTAAFLIAGAGTLALAVAIRALTRGRWGSLAGSLLVGIYGLGAIVAGIVPTDRIDTPADMASLSTTGLIHSGAALISFVSMIAGMYVLTVTFWREAWWRPFSRWSALFPASALPLLFTQSEGPWVGIYQRALVAVVSAWMILVALRIRAHAENAEAGDVT